VIERIKTLALFESSVAFIDFHHERQVLKEESIKQITKSDKKKYQHFVLEKELVMASLCIIIKVLSNKYLLIEERMEVEEQSMKLISKLEFVSRRSGVLK